MIRWPSIDQLSFAAILAHARQQAGRLSAVPGDVIGGVAVDALTLIPATPAADVGLHARSHRALDGDPLADAGPRL